MDDKVGKREKKFRGEQEMQVIYYVVRPCEIN